MQDIVFEQQTITIRERLASGNVQSYHVMAKVALGTGLAYIEDRQADGEPQYTVTHVATGGDVSGWYVSEEQSAQKWIAALNTLIDYTSSMPAIRAGKLGQVLLMAAVGVLRKMEDEEENAEKQKQHAF